VQEEDINMFERLKKKWGIKSNKRLIIIFIVFAITGSTAAKIATPVASIFGIDDHLSPFIYWPLRLLLIFPIYQILLIIFGWLFGEFYFFLNFVKKMLRIAQKK